MSSVKGIFDWVVKEEAVIVTDSAEYVSHLLGRGVHAENIHDMEILPAKSIVLSFSKGASKRAFEIAKISIEKECIFCALHVFESSLSHADYALSLLAGGDFYSSLESQKKNTG